MFNKKMDELFGIESPEANAASGDSRPVHEQTPVDPNLPEENEFEDEVPQDEEAVPTDPDPFAAMLDQMLAAEGIDPKLEKRRKYDPTKGDLNQHVWETAQERMFSGEEYKFRCKRCLKWVVVGNEETISDALVRTDVDPSCGAQVVSDIMKS